SANVNKPFRRTEKIPTIRARYVGTFPLNSPKQVRARALATRPHKVCAARAGERDMSDVVLSSATRSSIIALQQIAKRMDMLQTRLATGKRVNSASDDPAAFFTSMAMNARSATLNSLLTNMATAQGAVDATNKGIAAIQSLLSSAQNVANQALQSANT